MPALVNSRVGSFCGTRGELGTGRWPAPRRSGEAGADVCALHDLYGEVLGVEIPRLFAGPLRSLFRHLAQEGNDSTRGKALARRRCRGERLRHRFCRRGTASPPLRGRPGERRPRRARSEKASSIAAEEAPRFGELSLQARPPLSPAAPAAPCHEGLAVSCRPGTPDRRAAPGRFDLLGRVNRGGRSLPSSSRRKCGPRRRGAGRLCRSCVGSSAGAWPPSSAARSRTASSPPPRKSFSPGIWSDDSISSRGHVGGGLDALDLELELVRVGGALQGLVERDQAASCRAGRATGRRSACRTGDVPSAIASRM